MNNSCSLISNNITEDNTENLLSSFDIALVASHVFLIDPELILAKNKSKILIKPRYACYFVTKTLGMSLASAGRLFQIDATTMLHGRRRAEVMAQEDPRYNEKLTRFCALVAKTQPCVAARIDAAERRITRQYMTHTARKAANEFMRLREIRSVKARNDFSAIEALDDSHIADATTAVASRHFAIALNAARQGREV